MARKQLTFSAKPSAAARALYLLSYWIEGGDLDQLGMSRPGGNLISETIADLRHELLPEDYESGISGEWTK